MSDFLNIVDIYRNPIFGILALIVMILLIAFIDLMKKNHAKKRKKEALNNISKNFENINLNENIKNFIDYTDNPVPPLVLIADTYSKVGNNEQAIAIYRTLNDYIKNPKEKIQILESLGECYYKAGFLERSKEIFTEILRNYPHNVTILYNYMYNCENLKQYSEALEALKCIEELYEDNHIYEKNKNTIFHNKNYLKTMIIINNHKLKLVQQQEKLLEMYDLDSTLHGLILRHFRIYNVGLFWQKILEKKNIKPYIDVLWQFQKHEIPFEFIAKDSNLLNIYRAKGYIKEYVEIDDFALESLQLLNLYSHIKGELEFVYKCNACGGNSPFYTYRCHICNEINTIKLQLKITQSYKRDM